MIRTGRPLLATQEHARELVARGEVEARRCRLGRLARRAATRRGPYARRARLQSYDEGKRYTERDKDLLAFVGAAHRNRPRAHPPARRDAPARARARDREPHRPGARVAARSRCARRARRRPDRARRSRPTSRTSRFLDADGGRDRVPVLPRGRRKVDQEPVPLGDGPTSRVLRSREPLLVHGAGATSPRSARGGSAPPPGSYLGVPILAGRRRSACSACRRRSTPPGTTRPTPSCSRRSRPTSVQRSRTRASSATSQEARSRGRRRQRGEERVPRVDEPRDPHADERDHRHERPARPHGARRASSTSPPRSSARAASRC